MPHVSGAAREVPRFAVPSAIPTGDLKNAAIAWLATVGADTVATIEQRPGATIVPSLSLPSTGGGRALAEVAALADVNRVTLGEVIGEGGMGVVRSAEQVALGRPVAVKTLKPTKRDASASLDLLREAWVTGALEHPNIVPVHALQLEPDGTPSIVMKKVAGVEWSTLIADPDEVAKRFGSTDLLAWNLEILMRVLDALRFAHSHGIVHRDLKPANVMIGDFGEVYLLDWGIAVSLRDDGTGRLPLAVHATQLAGTPSYMAPEMLGREGGPQITERTDVYLAGAVLYELIAGKPPHAGSNMFAMIVSVMASRVELPATAPPELARICARAMAAEPDHRFASVDDLRRELRGYLEHRGSEQITTRAGERLDELRAKLAEPAPAEQDIYRLFGASRYGFRDALAVWPDNEAAKTGLVEAIVAVARYELAHDRPHAAVSLLGELTAPHPLLDQASAAVAKQSEHIAELERLGRQHDHAIGTRTRAVLTLGFGIAFTIIPLLVGEIPAMRDATHPMQAAFAFALMLAVAGAFWWARESIGATTINRRLAASVLFLFAVQGVVAASGWVADLPAAGMYRWNLAIYVAFIGMLTISIDVYLWIPTVGYAVALLLASREPEYTMQLTSAANAVFTVVASWRWKPGSIRFTDEERSERTRRRR
jgi:serine/threonine-protein kinase